MSLMILAAVLVMLVIAMPLKVVGGVGSLGATRDDLMEGFEEFNQDKAWYIADKVYPLSPTNQQKASHSRIPRETSSTVENNVKRKPDGTYPRMTIAVEDSSYECFEYGVEIGLDDSQVRRLAISYNLAVDRIAGDIAWNQIRRQYEKRVADQVMDATTNFTAGQANYTDVSGSNPWATASSDHIKTVHDAMLAIALRGYAADSIALSEKQWLNLIHSSQFAGRLQYVREATFQAIADFIAPSLGVRNIFVGKPVYNTTAEGGTYSGSRIWSDTYVNVFALGKLGVTKIWTPDAPSIVVMEQYRSDATRGNVIRARQNVDELALDVLAGQLLKVA